MFNNHQMHSTLRQVAIIGSGLSGLAAARQLEAAGAEVKLFEKSRGPGGRMAAKRLSTNGVGATSADIGAQFFTIRNPAFRAFLQQYAGEDSFGLWPGRFRFQGPDNAWQEMRPAERYVGIPRMSAVTRAISLGLDIENATRIDRLGRAGPELWTLIDVDGVQYEGFDTVLVTAPPAQSRALFAASGLEELAADINIRISRMQACWTVMLHLPTGAGLDANAYMPNSPLLNWAANNSSKPGRNDQGEWWVLHGDADWSDSNTDTNPQEVARLLAEEFRRVTGTEAKPEETLTHRWLYARPRARTGPGHLWFDAHRIGVVGDWLEGGRVEGAFNSADSLMRRLESQGLIGQPSPA